MTGGPAAASSRALDLLRESGALLEGHFLLSSGRHAGRYVQCAKLFQDPPRAAEACAALADLVRASTGDDKPFDVVVGPALGAVVMAYELARALGVRGVFAERDPEKGFALRRGFSIEPGERVLVAEDVVTTGGSVRELLAALADSRPASLAVASLVDRSGGDSAFGDHPFHSLARLEIPSWEEGDCPLCAEGAGPAVKPGSRPDLA